MVRQLLLYQGVENKNAEEVGFEPTVPFGTTVFKTAAFDLSATPPLVKIIRKIHPSVKAKRESIEFNANPGLILRQKF